MIDEQPTDSFMPSAEDLQDMTPEQREAYIGDVLHFNKWIADPERRKEGEFKHIIKDLETSNLNIRELFNAYYDLELIDLLIAYPNVFPKSTSTSLRDLYGYMALSKSKGGMFMKALTTKYNENRQTLTEKNNKSWSWPQRGGE